MTLLDRQVPQPEKGLTPTDREVEMSDQRVADLKAVMGTIEGRRFVQRLLKLTKPLESPMQTSSKIYFDVGLQYVGLWLFNQLKDTCLRELLLAENEEHVEEEIYHARRSQTTG